MYINPDVESSYKANDLGRFFYNTVILTKPQKIIEFGTLNGYSAIAMGQALRDLNRGGKIICYDLWEKYPFKNSTKENCLSNIKKYGLEDYITLEEKDFYKWQYESYDLLHFDISNHGEKIKDLHQIVKFDNTPLGLVLFEGGSRERDKVPWMQDFLPINNSNINFITLEETFPSISLLL